MSAGIAARWHMLARIAAVAFAAVAANTAALAQHNQGPPNALQGFSQNRDQPVKIEAASLEVREKENRATFSGDVHVVQGDTELRCKTLVIFYEKDANGRGAPAMDAGADGGRQIRRIEAKGGVLVTQKDQNATGDNGIFDMRANTVTLVGNVVVTRGRDVLRGNRLVVDLENGVSKMDQGRVEGLFQSGARSLEKR
jgi:lipopolysaccharide export system protein LptA